MTTEATISKCPIISIIDCFLSMYAVIYNKFFRGMKDTTAITLGAYLGILCAVIFLGGDYIEFRVVWLGNFLIILLGFILGGTCGIIQYYIPLLIPSSIATILFGIGLNQIIYRK